MIVLDASVATRMLLPFQGGQHIEQLLVDLSQNDIHVPSHFKIELLSALRGICFKGVISAHELSYKSTEVRDFIVTTHGIDGLIPRIIELAHNATPYDAAYVALAEALDCPLVTCDKRIADIPGVRAKVVIV